MEPVHAQNLAVSHEDIVRGRKDIWSRDFTQNVSGPKRKLGLLSMATFQELKEIQNVMSLVDRLKTA